MKRFCPNFENLWMGYNPYLKRVEVYKCCIKRNPNTDLVKYYSIDEWKSIDNLYEELSSLVNIWPENFNKTILGPYCYEVDECYYPHPVKLKRVEVSLLPHCNLKCEFCGVHFDQEEIKKNNDGPVLKELYFDTLYKLKGHNMDALRLTEFGEPLFFKKETLDFIKSCTLNDFKSIIITTNGTLIDDECLKVFKNSPINIMPMISFNAWDKESYKRIMGRDMFDKVLETVFKIKDTIGFNKVNFTFQTEEDYYKIKEFSDWLETQGIHSHIQPDNRNYDTLIKLLE